MRSGFSFRNMEILVKFLEDNVIVVTSKSQMCKSVNSKKYLKTLQYNSQVNDDLKFVFPFFPFVIFYFYQ